MAQNFDSTLEIFRRNTLEYKVTGNSTYKIAADNAQRWLDEYIGAIRESTTKNAAYIDKFVKEYEQTNPDLVKMQQQMKEIRKKGPVLQDNLETEQEADEELPIDYTSYYTKGAVLGTVLAIVAVASFF